MLNKLLTVTPLCSITNGSCSISVSQNSTESEKRVFDVELVGHAGYLTVLAQSEKDLVRALEPVRDKVADISASSFVPDNEMAKTMGWYDLASNQNQRPLACVVDLLAQKRRLWWIADSKSVADEWVADIQAKGGTVERQISVVFAINPQHAKRFFGTEIDVSSYLDEDLSTL